MNRRLWNMFFVLGVWLAVAMCGVGLVSLIGVIAWYGVGAINLDFLLTGSQNFGADGGIF